MDNNQIDSIVKAVMAQLAASGGTTESVSPAQVQRVVETAAASDNTAFAEIEDIAAPEVKHRPLLDNPADPDGLQRMLS